MVGTCRRLAKDFGALYIYTESDEVSVLLPAGWDLFDREVVKSFPCLPPSPASRTSTVIDYFRWRQGDATRGALNGWAYWMLRKSGMSAGQATVALKKATKAEKNDLLFKQGINFDKLPAWQRRGTGLRWEVYEKSGLNPLTGDRVLSTRRRLRLRKSFQSRKNTVFMWASFLPDQRSRAAT